MSNTIKYTMNRKHKGSRTFFFITVDGIRLNGTNYARKYDAENHLTALIRHYGIDGLLDLIAKAKAKKAA